MKIVTRTIGVRNLPKYLQEAGTGEWTVIAVVPAEYYNYSGPGSVQQLKQVIVVIAHTFEDAEEPIG